ncbi:hypothetical protein HELRODRAFT_163807 [Helobdella robusta]|uniref:Uncharacterized protein n=1 Tax=Helobdella robusta TaxID=6412 RepID=T1EUH9_HELRO|nr:hypothetical protein HELRODRAFT_163807 [Helobdella robusta]ESN96711.1 hypothetical protein HELRODRAFT_163807 [Helobdella robusta]
MIRMYDGEENININDQLVEPAQQSMQEHNNINVSSNKNNCNNINNNCFNTLSSNPDYHSNTNMTNDNINNCDDISTSNNSRNCGRCSKSCSDNKRNNIHTNKNKKIDHSILRPKVQSSPHSKKRNMIHRTCHLTNAYENKNGKVKLEVN